MKKSQQRLHLLPFDILIIILMAVAGIFLTVRGLGQKGSRVVVNAAGVKYEYSASQNGTYSVAGDLGTTTFEIKDGRVRIIDSPCPNKTCINQGWHNPLVCLPNKVMISVEGEADMKAGNGSGQGRDRRSQGIGRAAGQSRGGQEVELDAVSE